MTPALLTLCRRRAFANRALLTPDVVEALALGDHRWTGLHVVRRDGRPIGETHRVLEALAQCLLLVEHALHTERPLP